MTGADGSFVRLSLIASIMTATFSKHCSKHLKTVLDILTMKRSEKEAKRHRVIHYKIIE